MHVYISNIFYNHKFTIMQNADIYVYSTIVINAGWDSAFLDGVDQKLFRLESALSKLGDRILCAPSKFPSTGREGLRMLPSQSKLLHYSSLLP